jgi:hypothetical protein
MRLAVGAEQVDLALPDWRGAPPPAHPDLAPFLVAPAGPPSLSLSVHAVDAIPEDGARPALHKADQSWTLQPLPTGLRLDVFHPAERRAKCRVLIDHGFSAGELLVRQRYAYLPEIVDPAVHLLLLHRLDLARDGLMLHALGVERAGVGLVFVGKSGAGKSTLARLFASAGYRVLCDECVILRRRAGVWRLFGTPFHGEWAEVAPGGARLEAVFLIRHAPRHSLEPLGAGALARDLLPQLYMSFWDPPAIAAALELVDQLASEAPCRYFSFAKSPDAVAFLERQAPADDGH